MRFVSIYIPSYAHQRGSAQELWEKYWRIAFLVLAVHVLAFSLLTLKPKSKTDFNNELAIDLSEPIVISQTTPRPAEEESEVSAPVKKSAPQAKSVLIAKPQAPLQPVEVPRIADSIPVVKFNEELTKTAKVERDEKPIPVVAVEKSEEKKPQVQAEAPTQAQAEPKLTEAMTTALPAFVDKKNRDKDAPEIPPVGKAGASSSLPASDSTKSSGLANPSSAGNPGGSSAANTAVTGSNAISASSGFEVQAQVTNSKSTGSSSGTTDADYKSESLRNPPAHYPIYARKMHQEGTVMVLVEVLVDGSAGDVRIATSSGIKLLDQAALETIKQWHFTPAKKNGVTYVQALRVPVTFSLNSK